MEKVKNKKGLAIIAIIILIAFSFTGIGLLQHSKADNTVVVDVGSSKTFTLSLSDANTDFLNMYASGNLGSRIVGDKSIASINVDNITFTSNNSMTMTITCTGYKTGAYIYQLADKSTSRILTSVNIKVSGEVYKSQCINEPLDLTFYTTDKKWTADFEGYSGDYKYENSSSTYDESISMYRHDVTISFDTIVEGCSMVIKDSSQNVVVTFFITIEDHTFTDWKTEQEATCIDVKKESRECIKCEYKEERNGETFGDHQYEIVSGKDATCSEDGLTDGKKCTVCGEILVAQEKIPAKGHTEEVVKGTPATCTEEGLTDGKKCSVCGDVLVAQKSIAAVGHDYKDGVCTRCGVKDPDYKSLNGVVKGPDGKWGYYKNNVLQEKYTGFQSNEYGHWYIENGYVNFDKNDILRDGANGWWKVEGGKVNFNYTGVAKNQYGWWRVENGKVNFNAQGIYKNDYGWWKTTDGKVTFKENGIFKNEYGWWKVENSKVNFKYTGVAKNDYGWWRVENGKVNFKANGLYKNEYGTWYVKNGKVDFGYNGTYQGYNVKNGKVTGKATAAKTSTKTTTQAKKAASNPTSNSSSSKNGYVASKNSKKFHKASCGEVNNIKSGNRVYYDTRQQAINAGHNQPCNVCNP